MTEIMVNLQGGAKAPLYEQIYEYIKNDIADGKISKGEKLPSTRLLAKQLAVSRSTVELAYEQLLAEGYIQTKPRCGYFVCDVEELYRLERKTARVSGNFGGRSAAGAAWDVSGGAPCREKTIDFSPHAIDTESFPYNVWRKLHRNVLLDERAEILSAGDGQGDYGLRAAIADYLHQARGVSCTPEQIVVGAGNEYLEILLSQILGEGKTVLMEDPTYLQAYRTFGNAGYHVRCVAGELSEELLSRENPDLLYVMPSHQFPLGTVMPLKQRLALLKWAQGRAGRYLLEDDHDSEYRYKGKPIPALQGMDRAGCVIYIGTFSKSIAPALRVSYMVLPPSLLPRYAECCGFYSATVPRVEQEVLREFIRDGYFGRHLNKMRALYKNKHDFLVGELKKCPWVTDISGDNAGLHVLVQTVPGRTEREIVALAGERGVCVTGISEYYIQKREAARPVLLIGYGGLSERQMSEGLRRLSAIWTDEV